MTSFSLDLAKFGQKALDNADEFVRKIGLDLHKMIVERMPVETGLAKGNQQVSLNSMPEGSILEFDKSGNATISKGRAVLSRFKLGDTIFLFNNLEYVVPLEYGHSQKQAPNGMFRISFAEITDHLEKRQSAI